MFSFTLRPPYNQGKSPISVGYKAGWDPELVWTLWQREKKNPFTASAGK
jgi:hypothetical protein